MDIYIAQFGLCWGIELTYDRLNKLAQTGEVHVTHRWGPSATSLVWDPIRRIVETDDAELHKRYPDIHKIKLLETAKDACSDMTIAVGHHGSSEEEHLHAMTAGANLHDFKCPFIAKSDKTAKQLAEAGYDIIAFGKVGNHHCEYARAAAEAAGRVGVVAEDVDHIKDILVAQGRNWALMGQVTANVEKWKKFQQELAILDLTVKVVDTVCTDSHDRQSEAIALAKKVDLVLVINDNGGSTKSVLERCLTANTRSILVDPNAKLPDLSNCASVAIVGGIHVPTWIMKQYADRLRGIAA